MIVGLPPHSVQFRGSAVARRVLGWLGWELEFRGLPAAQGVLVVYPHTSNWDFPVGLLAKWAFGLQARFWAKHTLFQVPLFGAWLRWLGGVPINRADAGGVVEQTAQRMRACRQQGEYFWLVVTPEGTRSWRPAWRSGFYRLALAAQVPVGLAVLDFGRKRIRITDFVTLSGDVEADMGRIALAFEGSAGMRAALAAPIRLENNKEKP